MRSTFICTALSLLLARAASIDQTANSIAIHHEGHFAEANSVFEEATVLESKSNLRGDKNIDNDESGRKLLSTRQQSWLDSHNKLRKEFHEANDKTYEPLKWSNALRSRSLKFAKTLASEGCALRSDPNNKFGQNLAVKYYSSTFQPTDDVLDAFKEKASSGYPANGSYTQAVWRATEYVGCADAKGTDSSGKPCVVSVCRYAKPGNCNMSGYTGNKWKTPALEDDSACGPSCPPGGCV
mmetsp:Transcript_6618/g.14339  ORF Transcript_6618/g.14339 Transcript_6618/m.14339 type:complete len:239 (-) Transcript_6618:28-744(-)